MTAGRPTDYSDEIAALICSEISSGRSLRSICDDADMPNRATVFKWLAKHASFNDQYAKAQEERTNHFAEEIMEIADEVTGDTQRDKLRVDTRKWLMSKMAPKRFGDKITQEHTGEGGGPVQFITVYEQPKDA